MILCDSYLNIVLHIFSSFSYFDELLFFLYETSYENYYQSIMALHIELSNNSMALQDSRGNSHKKFAVNKQRPNPTLAMWFFCGLHAYINVTAGKPSFSSAVHYYLCVPK